MNKKKFIERCVWVVLLHSLFFIGCSEKSEKNADEHKVTYTCPMHPQIVQDKAGTCPICGMDLVIFDRTNKDEYLTISQRQIELANITTQIIGDTVLSNVKQLNGRLAVNPDKTIFVSSRVAGRIEHLYIKEPGVKVSRGQVVYEIYSEQLAALQQEYLLAYAQARQFPQDDKFIQIEAAAKHKLILYGQTEHQIEKMVKGQKSDPYVTYVSPVSGVVAELSVSEGQYVSEGSSVLRIESYDELWVEADLYPAEASVVKVGQVVKVVVAGWENNPEQMKIQFINPNLQNGSQLLQVRGTLSNYKGNWQPGMQAGIHVPIQRKSSGLSIPVDAVIRGSNGAHVWQEVTEGKFEPRRVKTGVENSESVEIIEGLDAGDKIVITGAYLLNSEYILKKGVNPMTSHNH